MASLRRERALIRQKPAQTSITTSLITEDDICVTMITAPSSDDNDNAQLFTLLDCQINITRPVHSALFVAWLDLESGHKWEYRDRNSTSVKCVAAPGRVKPKSQQARGRMRNAECDPSWDHHYYGQGTHDTASTIYKLSQVPLSSVSLH